MSVKVSKMCMLQGVINLSHITCFRCNLLHEETVLSSTGHFKKQIMQLFPFVFHTILAISEKWQFEDYLLGNESWARKLKSLVG